MAEEAREARYAQGTVGIVGAGAAGTALARRLHAAGVHLILYARRPMKAATLRTSLGAGAELAETLPALGAARTLLIAVSDRAIEAVASDLAQALGPRGPEGRAKVALHASGYHDEGPLAPLARAGWSTGAAHPLVSIARGPSGAAALEGAWFALCGDDRARQRGRALVLALGGHELTLARGSVAKHRYHASAALLAGGLAVLLEQAQRGIGAEMGGAEGRAALTSLARSVLDNFARDGAVHALTGPVVRGDVEVLRGHLTALDGSARALYATLLPYMSQLAHERGTLDERAVHAIGAAVRAALETPSGE